MMEPRTGPRFRIEEYCWRAAILFAALALSACDASYPTTPISPKALTLQIHVSQPFGEASVRSGYSFLAYTLRSDGAWENVTFQATWSSFDPVIFRSTGAGRFIADAPGVAGVLVQYQGLAAALDVIATDATRQPLPRLSIRPSGPPTVGTIGQATVTLLSITGGSRDVTAEATWESSDPSVASVHSGQIAALAPGTTRITVSDEGLVGSYVFSVRPPDRLP